MTFRQFLTFGSVARHQNVTKAAQELHTSQPAISRQLKLLQETYRIQLYERIGRGIRLTDAGKLLLKDADLILKRLGKLETKLKSIAAAPAKSPILMVGGGYNVSGLLFPKLLIEFRRSHPEIQANLRTAHKETLERLIARGKVGIALVTNPTRSAKIISEKFRHRELVALVRSSSPLARKPKLSITELAQYPLVIRGSREGTKVRVILNHMEKRGLPHEVFMYCDSANMLKAALRETNGVGLLYEDVTDSDFSNGEFRMLRLKGLRLTAKISIAYRKDKPLSPAARDLLLLLRRWRDRSPQRFTRRTERNNIDLRRVGVDYDARRSEIGS